MKNVVSNHSIAHMWMHQTQARARNAGHSYYFEGDTIYSYGSHFPIARHITNAKGQKAILFTTRTYSMTTAHHLSLVRRSIPQDALVFYTPSVFLPDGAHQANVERYKLEIRNAVFDCSRARSTWRKERHHERALNLANEARAYARFFGLKLGTLPAVPELDSEELEAIREREKANEAKKAAETRRKQELFAAQQEENCNRWRSGERISLLGGAWGLPVMLRFVPGDDSQVETSRGAVVPSAHALRLLAFVRRVVSSGQEYRRNGHTFHVGQFPVDRIEPDGTLHAGCHVITYQEIERMGKQLETRAGSEPHVYQGLGNTICDWCGNTLNHPIHTTDERSQ